MAKLSDLQFDSQNARKRTKRSSAMLQQSLQQVGAARSIVIDEHGVILAGNGTVEAAGQVGIEDVRIIDATGDELIAVRRTGLSEEQKLALALYDNQTAALAEWDAGTIAALDAAFPQTLAEVFFPDELAAIKATIEALDTPAPMLGGDEFDTTPVAEGEATRTSTGQYWALGKHRLYVGDCVDTAAVYQLFDGCTPTLSFCDPPYGYKFQSSSRAKSPKFPVLRGDDAIDGAFLSSIASRTNGWVLVCTSWKVVAEWIEVTRLLGELQNVIVWDKGGGGMGDLQRSLSTDYELILAYNREAPIYGKRIGSVWNFDKDNPNAYQHPTQKPIALLAQVMQSFSADHAAVYDPFLGSGTTLIAAERTKRVCYGCEIEPRYADVILKRWEAETGQTAQLLS